MEEEIQKRCFTEKKVIKFSKMKLRIIKYQLQF